MPLRAAAARCRRSTAAVRRPRLAYVSEHRGADESMRFLLALDDGRTIESVLLPGDGVCVSTQVGCAVGCVFCMTGRDGLARQLTSGEIVAQVALARARQRVRRVVFMGMGEPAHNLDNVLDAVTLLGDAGRSRDRRTSCSRRSATGASSSGCRSARSSRRSRCRCTRRRPELRAQLLPRAPRIEPAELVALADAYSRATKYPTQYQWTLARRRQRRRRRARDARDVGSAATMPSSTSFRTTPSTAPSFAGRRGSEPPR